MKHVATHSHLILILGLSCVGLLAADVPLVPPPDSDAAPGFYSVTEQENQLELKTPYGTIHIPTGFGPNVPYRLSIPVEQLKKGGAPVAEDVPHQEKPEEAGKPGGAPALFPAPSPALGLAPANAPPSTTVIVDDADSLVVDANRLFNRRRFYEALTVVDQLLRKRPAYARGWLMKGSLLLVQGHKDLALKAWTKAKELEPENQEVLSVLEKYK